MRKKYVYFLNSSEVSKEKFISELEFYCQRCDTNYSNPLLNWTYTDEKKLNSMIRKMKSRGDIYVFDDANFRIKTA